MYDDPVYVVCSGGGAILRSTNYSSNIKNVDGSPNGDNVG